MKDYEIYSQLRIPKISPIIMRIDGRAFHSLADKISLNKPYDENFKNLMADVCEDILREFSPSFIYTFSDEISVLLNEIPFSRRIEKIDSVMASFTSSSFTIHYADYFDEPLYKPVAFDCRAILPDMDNVVEYFKWRQDEAWRNCVNSYGIWFLKSRYSADEANERISGLKNRDIHEMLFKEGINLNDIPNWQKRGLAVYKKRKEIEGFNKKENVINRSYRNYAYIDLDLPIFSDTFFNEIDVI